MLSSPAPYNERMCALLRSFLRLILSLSLLAPGAALLAAGTAHSQDWPGRPVRIIVPFAPGGVAETAHG